MSSMMQLTGYSRAVDEKIHVGFFSRRFSHMRGTIWKWNVKKLEDGGSQMLVTCHLTIVALFLRLFLTFCTIFMHVLNTISRLDSRILF